MRTVRFRASCLQNCALEQILGGGKRSGGRWECFLRHTLALELANPSLPAWHHLEHCETGLAQCLGGYCADRFSKTGSYGGEATP